MAKIIRVNVPIDFTKGVTIETEGFSGMGCKHATDALEKALGQVTHDEDTEEMNFTEQQQHNQQTQ